MYEFSSNKKLSADSAAAWTKLFIKRTPSNNRCSVVPLSKIEKCRVFLFLSNFLTQAGIPFSRSALGIACWEISCSTSPKGKSIDTAMNTTLATVY